MSLPSSSATCGVGVIWMEVLEKADFAVLGLICSSYLVLGARADSPGTRRAVSDWAGEVGERGLVFWETGERTMVVGP
jgi:hypothetical protein